MKQDKVTGTHDKLAEKISFKYGLKQKPTKRVQIIQGKVIKHK